MSIARAKTDEHAALLAAVAVCRRWNEGHATAEEVRERCSAWLAAKRNTARERQRNGTGPQFPR